MRSDAVKRGLERAPHRALLRALGCTDREIEQPFVGVISSYNEAIPGHMGLRQVADAVKAGTRMAGGTPFECNTIAVCDGLAMNHPGMRYSLASRELIADSVEVVAEAHAFDALVLIPNCDKVVPGILMAAARLNLPTIVVSGGPMLAGSLDGRAVDLANVFMAVGAVARGEMSTGELDRLEQAACPGCGSYAGMFTANTMNCLTEALGMGLPGHGTIPATHAGRLSLAKRAGMQVMALLTHDIRPRDILVPAAFGNAFAVDMALGGSTNSVLHLLAVAHETGIEIPLGEVNRYSACTPHLCRMSPAAEGYHVEDLDRAGGIPAVMRRLLDGGLLDGDVLTVAGRTLAESLVPAAVPDSSIIRPLDAPHSPTGGLAVLFGNLAPDGAVVKQAVVAPLMRQHTGPARVFDSEEGGHGGHHGRPIRRGGGAGHSLRGPPRGARDARDVGADRASLRHGAGRPGGPGHRWALLRRDTGRGHRPRLPRICRRRLPGRRPRRRPDPYRHPQPHPYAAGAGGRDRPAPGRTTALGAQVHIRLPAPLCPGRHLGQHWRGVPGVAQSTRSPSGPAESRRREERRFPMRRTGAQAVWESLLREGVETVFGISGGAVLALYHALPEYPIRHVLMRHEQAAAHAADGYARATGKAGVCIATSGPGATNLVTGLATACMDSSPLVAITGQVASPVIGTDAFQEVHITAITLPITKHNYLVTAAPELPRVIKEAFYIARTGRPGPVLVDIARDAQGDENEYAYPNEVRLPGHSLRQQDPSALIQEAARMIDEVQRPVIIAGHGVILANAEEALLELARKADLPVATTLLGVGSLPEEHPLCLGMGGMHGTIQANKALSEADLIVSLGSRFDDRLTGPAGQFARQARIIHVDIDPAEIGKIVPADLAVVGDLQDVLPALAERVGRKDRSAWLARIQEWRSEHAQQDALNQETDELLPQYVVRQIWQATEGNAIMVSDMGQNQMWEAQYFVHHRRRGLISSGGLGTMGFALPAAIGAQMGRRDEQVWVVAGDGGFQMNIQELATVVQEGLPSRIAILNNGYLGMVRQWQELFFGSATPARCCRGRTLPRSPRLMAFPA